MPWRYIAGEQAAGRNSYVREFSPGRIAMAGLRGGGHHGFSIAGQIVVDTEECAA